MSDTLSPQALRQDIRAGRHTGNTSGYAAGFVQCNIVILPADQATDFLRFCQSNPKPCPLIASSVSPGDPSLPPLGDIDIRTDVPSYRVFREGVCEEEISDISHLWRDDLVTVALGCSFSFEEALLADGLALTGDAITAFTAFAKRQINTVSASPGEFPYHPSYVVLIHAALGEHCG